MQLDLFGATAAEATQPSAPPVQTQQSVWRTPESLALDAACRAGSLIQVIAILNKLKVDAAAAALLASGFSVSTMKDRAQLMKDIQPQLVAAVRSRMTGFEWRAAREARPAVVETPAPAVNNDQNSGTLFNNFASEQKPKEHDDHASTVIK